MSGRLRELADEARALEARLRLGGGASRIATSCARSIFVIVSGHQEPAFTVASFATTTTGLPCTMPTPVTTPAPGA